MKKIIFTLQTNKCYSGSLSFSLSLALSLSLSLSFSLYFYFFSISFHLFSFSPLYLFQWLSTLSLFSPCESFYSSQSLSSLPIYAGHALFLYCLFPYLLLSSPRVFTSLFLSFFFLQCLNLCISCHSRILFSPLSLFLFLFFLPSAISYLSLLFFVLFYSSFLFPLYLGRRYTYVSESLAVELFF